MIFAVITLGVVAIANAALAAFVFWMGHKERAALLDRIQAPEAARLATYTQSLDTIPTAEEVEAQIGVGVQWDDDLQMLMSEEDD